MQDLMQSLERWAQAVTDFLNTYVMEIGPSFNGETVPIMVVALLGTGVYLTLRLGFIQIRHLGHGFGVTSGKYDDPEEPGDVSHFQALTTALSATVGIGNIAGVVGPEGAPNREQNPPLLRSVHLHSKVTLAETVGHEIGPDRIVSDRHGEF